MINIIKEEITFEEKPKKLKIIQIYVWFFCNKV